jgi:predicted Zn-dependent protease
MRIPRKITSLIAALALACLAAACAPVAGTGRSQLNLVNDAELNQAATLQYRQLINESRLSSNRSETLMLKRVGARISQAAKELMASLGRSDEIANYQWEFNLIDSKEVNAFCMPGGKVAFYTGILPVCASEAGVAAVMGHEVAHALARHANERASQQMVANIGATLLNVGLSIGGASGAASELAMTAFAVGSQYGVLLPFSRAHEAEADRIGMSLMAMAGYEPQEAVELWRRMAQLSGRGSTPYFMSTHPSDAQRIKNLETYLPEARSRYKAAGK